MNIAAKHDRELYTPPSMKGPLVTSGILHAVILILSIIGLPFIAKKPIIISSPINIEIVEIDKITQTNKPAPPKKAPEKLEKPKPPKVVAESPPDLIKPPPPKIEKIVEKPLEKKVKPKPKKPKAKPKPPKKQTDFASLLKNLAPDIEDEAPKVPDQSQENGIEESQIARLSDRLTVSELDSFKRQIEPCWNIPAGAKYAENLSVEIRVLMNPDMTLQSASILNQGRYTRDNHFRAAADSALRALRNPRCAPFKLPTNKYEQWKVITIRFDPRDML